MSYTGIYTTDQRVAQSFTLGDLIDITGDNGEGQPSVDIIEWALEKTDKEIDGYLIGLYPLPLQTIPDALHVKADDIVIYHLTYRRHKLTGTMPEAVENSYKRAIDYLMKVRSGDLDLYADEEVDSDGASSAFFVVHKPGTKRMFGHDTLNKMPL